MKVLSLFSGIGAFEKALDYLNVKYELVNYCEIDKYASKSYSLIHHVPESMNLGDITKVDTSKLPNDIDLITYGFPCQDISLAGNQKGFFQENIKSALKHLEFTDEEIQNLYTYIVKEKPSDSQLFDKLYDEFMLYEEDINALLLLGINKLTRSGLFFEALRIIEDTKPKIAIAENVKNLVSKKFKTEFNIVLKSLDEAGYNCYWQVLNSKNYGIPQNRERVFIVSIRKDIDNGSFEFPKPFELELRLKDMLEDNVDEKYYLSDKMLEYIKADNSKWTGNNGKALVNKDVASTLNTGEGQRRCDASNYVSEELPDNYDLKQNRADIVLKHLVETDQIKDLPCCCDSTINEPKVREISNCITSRYDAGIQNQKQIGLCVVVAAAQRGRGEGWKQQIEVSDREVANTITTAQKDSLVSNGLRIRKLTPKECFRLMGFEDEVIDSLVGVSNTQLYKQAGNSIVVDVVEEILVQLFKSVKLIA